jgi:tRNA threonylcarbamoyladenosine biosynthesis protein TsaE
MSSTHWVLQNESDWQPIAKEILLKRTGRDLWFLEGELGAGKTTFVRYLLRELGFDHVTSPTFSIHHSYDVGVNSVQHLDLYRIASLSEWNNLGLEELFLAKSGLILIEWASQIPATAWPKDWSIRKLVIRITPLGEREVTLANP